MTTTFEGIPTMYNGVQYRSRLEARWAVFFDLVGWKHQYEPFDLPGWIPDFVITESTTLLVEVKPVFDFPETIGKEIVESAREWLGLKGDEDMHTCSGRELLILGVAPTPERLGWLWEGSWGQAKMRYWTERLGFCHEWNSYIDRITGEYDGSHEDQLYETERLDALWKRAGNEVQWKKPH